MKKTKNFIIILFGILIVWFAGHFFSSPLSQKGEISMEDFVFCHIQVIEVVNDTGIGRAVKIKDVEETKKLLDFMSELEVRKSLPWEKIHNDVEEPYTVWLQYDSEEMGRYEHILCWKNGQINFRGKNYMIIDEQKVQLTDQLEWFLQNYETEE